MSSGDHEVYRFRNMLRNALAEHLESDNPVHKGIAEAAVNYMLEYEHGGSVSLIDVLPIAKIGEYNERADKDVAFNDEFETEFTIMMNVLGDFVNSFIYAREN